MAFLWAAARASSRLGIFAFHRGFRTPLNHTCLGIVDTRQVREDLENRAKSIPDNKECIVKTFKHPSEFENGMWMVGSNIYLADNDIIEARERNVGEDEEEEDTAGERWIDRDCCIGKPTDKRRLVGGIRYKVDNEKGTVAGVECFMLAKELEEGKVILSVCRKKYV